MRWIGRELDDRVGGRGGTIDGGEGLLDAASVLPVAIVAQHLFCGAAKYDGSGVPLWHDAGSALAFGERDVGILLGLEWDAVEGDP